MGYARVRASHLVQGAPTLTITELVAQKVRVAHLKEETLDITATNLSTHPNLLGKAPRVTVSSSAGSLGADLKLGGLGGESDGRCTARIEHSRNRPLCAGTQRRRRSVRST
jgi:hypothetical protein